MTSDELQEIVTLTAQIKSNLKPAPDRIDEGLDPIDFWTFFEFEQRYQNDLSNGRNREN